MSRNQRVFSTTQPASARYAESAHTRARRGNPSPMRRNTSTAPSQSVELAGRTASPQISPRVSTNKCRLRPDTFFPPVVPFRAARFCRLDALAVDHAGTGRFLPGQQCANIPAEDFVQLLPDPGVPPSIEVVRHRLPGREIVGHGTPLTSGSSQVENRIHDIFAVVGAWSSGRTGRAITTGKQVVNVLPLDFGQIARVGLPCSHARTVH